MLIDRSCSLTSSPQVRETTAATERFANHDSVPLASLLTPTQPPPSDLKPAPILSPEGRRRYFVTHGGLFSKDEVYLEDIRKISRIGRQPGQEGLMCKSL